MLALKPTCENCNKLLPPASEDAMICSFECTFCRNCVENVLQHVCPNCGGNFVSRPIRPAVAMVGKASLEYCPASTEVVYKPVDKTKHLALVEKAQPAQQK